MGGPQEIRVLHVDDEPDFAEMAAEFLERRNDAFVVETATSAREGLERFSCDDFDCIISDYEMPGQNGIEFLKTVREEAPELPFILFTGRGSEEVASDAIFAGVTDYLQKESGTDQYAVLANRVRNAVERYRAEQVRERQRAAIETAQEGIAILDENRHYIYVNQAFAQLHGYDPEEIVGEHWQLAYPDEDIPDVRENILPEVERTGYWHGETTSRRSDGTDVTVDHTLATTERGELVCTVRNVSEQKDRKKQIRDSTAKLEALFENSPEMINVHDIDGNIIDPNPVLSEATGYTEAELTEMKVWDIDQAIDPEEAHALWEDMTVGERRQLEGVYQRKDGSTFPTEVHIRRLDLDGEDLFMVISRDMTDHREREQQLQQSERLVEALSSALSDYFFIYDADGIYLDVITGWAGGPIMYEPDELIGQSVADILPTQSAEQVEAAIAQALTTGSIQTVEYSVGTKHGPYWYEGHLVPIPDGYDGTDAVLLTARDITDRRQREHALRELQDRTQQLMQTTSTEETAQVAVETVQTILDAELSGFHLLADDQKTLEPVAFTDTVRAEFDDPPIYDRNSESDPESTVVWKAVEKGEPLIIDDTSEYEGLTDVTPARNAIISPISDHGVFIVSATDPGTFDESDKALVDILATSLASALDRVEREVQLRKREQQLKTERDRLCALFEMIPEPVVHSWFDNGEPVVKDVNTAFEETFGYEADDIDSRSINDAIVPPDRRTEAEQLDERVQTEGTVKQEVHRHTADGVGDFLFRSVPVGEPSETNEYFGIYIDVSTQKAHERDLERQNERLDEFASVVSHDLRNPLNVATGRLELAQEQCDSQHLDTIDTALQRIDRIIENVLWLAREGRDIGPLESIAMQDAVDSSWRLVADDTDGAELHYANGDRSLPEIEADEDRFSQLLSNLFRNALEHGSEDVTVTVGAFEDGFYIEDDGAGIPPDARGDVFRAGYSTSEEGIGFGLSIVKQIIEAHGWNICIAESETGGARFEITDVEFVVEQNHC